MSTDKHTITIEPQTVYPGGISQLAVVRRNAGVFVEICCREDEVKAGATLTAVAQSYAQMYDAVYVPEGGAR